MKSIVIYLGGSGPERLELNQTEISAVIAADSGLELAHKHGVNVNLIVGDMDSVNPELLKQYEDNGTYISRFNQEKNETDFELALLAAKNYVADSLAIVGGGSGRLDHLLANISVASGELTETWETTLYCENEIIYVCKQGSTRTIPSLGNSDIAFIAIGGTANITTSGVKFEVTDFNLSPHTSRGISNVFTSSQASIKVNSGSVIAIVPSQ